MPTQFEPRYQGYCKFHVFGSLQEWGFLSIDSAAGLSLAKWRNSREVSAEMLKLGVQTLLDPNWKGERVPLSMLEDTQFHWDFQTELVIRSCCRRGSVLPTTPNYPRPAPSPQNIYNPYFYLLLHPEEVNYNNNFIIFFNLLGNIYIYI